MEFHNKLQALRKQKGLTQEELAEALFVSRTAVSKWESGRGYPNIDSLKAIAKFYRVTIDELLSGEEALTIAEETQKQRESHLRDMVFGAVDLCTVMALFLPLFGQKSAETVQSVPLVALTGIAPWLKIAYFAAVIGMIALGISTFALQNCQRTFWLQSKRALSLALNAAGTLLFIISPQPYAAVFWFIFLVIKGAILLKRQ